MLRSLESLIHYEISASDGDIGKVSDFYFDDERWVIRYLVADCGGFFAEGRVLISPTSFANHEFLEKRFLVALTKEKVKNSPSIDLAKPVSREHEREFMRYSEARDDPHLRSINEVAGYHVQGRDGDVGHVQDFIWDDRTWAIRYLVVDTSNWLKGRHVLVSPQWLTEISWADKRVKIDLPRELIKFSPQWKPEAAIYREYEEELHRYYARPAYWVEEERRQKEKSAATTVEILAEHR